MKKLILSILVCLSCIISTAQITEYKSHYVTVSESTPNQITTTETIDIETSLFFNYKDSLIILKTPTNRRIFWMLEYYEGVKEYVDATDNFNSYIFSFLYNKYGISDVLILEEKKEKTVVTDFHIYETKLK